MQRTYGTKYDPNLDTAEIAKRIRADIKEALAKGELPAGLKTSVRIDRFAGGSSIDIFITACPFPISNPLRLEHDAERPYSVMTTAEGWLHNEAARELQKKLEAIRGAYNHDGSDSQTDYFDVKFYGSVEFDWRLARAERDAFEAERALTAAAPQAEPETQPTAGGLYCLTGESGQLLAAREMAESLGGRFRAPHHTCSEIALCAEMALACGGVLYLDEATEFRGSSLRNMLRTWRQMDARHRPTVLLGVREPETHGAPLSAAVLTARTGNNISWGECVGEIDGTITVAAPGREMRGAA